jgi:hypothetical protein
MTTSVVVSQVKMVVHLIGKQLQQPLLLPKMQGEKREVVKYRTVKVGSDLVLTIRVVKVVKVVVVPPDRDVAVVEVVVVMHQHS